jgi:hypothetical protein
VVKVDKKWRPIPETEKEFESGHDLHRHRPYPLAELARVANCNYLCCWPGRLCAAL